VQAERQGEAPSVRPANEQPAEKTPYVAFAPSLRARVMARRHGATSGLLKVLWRRFGDHRFY
jgi:hypothetical protein